MNNRYAVEWLPNGLMRVFDRASQLSGCYHADGTYRHGDLRAPTLDALLKSEVDYLIIPHAQRTLLTIEEGISQ
ncbi:MAG: hypothetical protein M3R61_15750 [Chloroflexota bacterium]|nr:hypothetical protein [Chloroflexota bacterium]